ncbi:deoxyhypusine hydroxylase [Cyanidiococcus yangmingshanensis]|uniref:Deoxyhypusine hydroxylase n=1 Tax=Cyanidiococcus yangmingshanensis TaxID=2690220 RepID=A0A7J7ISF5_9RHOD|nr:deoxyhypusine hydroxylase [Cyanidiococcus yangmingshanensis]
MVQSSDVEELFTRLWCESVCVAEKMNVIFSLKEAGSDRAVTLLCAALMDPRERSVLVRHEIAYVLGQMQNPKARETLVDRLVDANEDTIVRHECGEALGAIVALEAWDTLLAQTRDPVPEVRETCSLALERLRWMQRQNGQQKHLTGTSRDKALVFRTVDPAPPFEVDVDPEASWSDEALGELLRDENVSLFRRYRAMFTLRDRNTDKTALIVSDALLQDRSSALFRHEAAYVLGQMCRPCTLAALEKALAKHQEHPMVRHEAAEAIGAVGTQEACTVLEQYCNDADVIVRESCLVALDIAADYAILNDLNP